jgi:hypothetical protein
VVASAGVPQCLLAFVDLKPGLLQVIDHPPSERLAGIIGPVVL